jgi:Putative lumazine-binding
MPSSPTQCEGEHAELVAVARDYLDGMFYADETKLRRAFHPQSLQVGHYRGRLEYDPLDTFVKFVTEGPASMPGTPYNAEIAVLEVAFDIAVVKVVDDWFGERYTDYLTMLKHDGKWSIVNKAFTVHPPM